MVNYRYLGNSGFKISEITYGNWVTHASQVGNEAAIATVHKALVGIRDRFVIETDGKNLKAHGNIVDHEYEIEQDGDKVAEVSKKWFRLRDTYGVDIRADVDPALILSITVAIDSFSHDHG